MTTYVINRFARVELPTFNPEWQALCDRCRHVSYQRKNHMHPNTPDNMQCTAAPTIRGGYVGCSEARHFACSRGQLFEERK